LPISNPLSRARSSNCAVASGAAVAVYQLAGWNALVCLGAAFAAAGLLYYFTERGEPRTFVQVDRETAPPRATVERAS